MKLNPTGRWNLREIRNQCCCWLWESLLWYFRGNRSCEQRGEADFHGRNSLPQLAHSPSHNLIWLFASLALNRSISSPGLSMWACKCVKEYFNSDCCLRITVDCQYVGAWSTQWCSAREIRLIAYPETDTVITVCSAELRRNILLQHRALTQIPDDEGFSSSLSLFLEQRLI